MTTLLRARWILPDAFHCLEGGGVLLDGGKVRALAPSGRALDQLERRPGVQVVDLGECVLTPGLVNAHAHLELSPLQSAPASKSFVEWVSTVLREMGGKQPSDFETCVEVATSRLTATGTTAVGNIDSSGAGARGLRGCALRARNYREFLDAYSPERTIAEIARLEGLELEASGPALGISPHAPHTVSLELLEACARVTRSRGLASSLHWAETSEERSWMLDGSGPFAPFLGASPRTSGFDQLERSGLLRQRTSLVHANHPEAGELRRAAEQGAVLVHCPGTQLFFDREPVDLEAWSASGATIALGTDSLASNDDLDMRLEMARVRSCYPGIAAETVFNWATRGGAFALGFEAEIGELHVGKSADVVAFSSEGANGRLELLDAVTSARLPVSDVWIAGETV